MLLTLVDSRSIYLTAENGRGCGNARRSSEHNPQMGGFRCSADALERGERQSPDQAMRSKQVPEKGGKTGQYQVGFLNTDSVATEKQ